MSDFKTNFNWSFSFFPTLALASGSYPKEDSKVIKGVILLNWLGYIPIVNTITAIARVIFILHQAKTNEYAGETKWFQISRAALEFTAILGPVLFITDLALTIFIVMNARLRSI